MSILSRLFRSDHNKPGIYRIRNRKNGKMYIGSTERTIFLRMQEHVEDLHAGVHHNHLLQADWDTYGIGAFAFEVMENVSEPLQIAERELYWQLRIPRGKSYVLQLARPRARRLKDGCLMPSIVEYTDNMYPHRLIYVLAWAMFSDGSFVWDADSLCALFAKNKVAENKAREAFGELVASIRKEHRPPMVSVTRDWIIELLARQRNTNSPVIIPLP